MEATSTEVYSSYKALERTARRAGMVQNDLRAPWNASERYDKDMTPISRASMSSYAWKADCVSLVRRYVSGDPQAFTELLQWSLTESGPKIARSVWQHVRGNFHKVVRKRGTVEVNFVLTTSCFVRYDRDTCFTERDIRRI